jgi:hypothetical protein
VTSGNTVPVPGAVEVGLELLCDELQGRCGYMGMGVIIDIDVGMRECFFATLIEHRPT